MTQGDLLPCQSSFFDCQGTMLKYFTSLVIYVTDCRNIQLQCPLKSIPLEVLTFFLNNSKLYLIHLVHTSCQNDKC